MRIYERVGERGRRLDTRLNVISVKAQSPNCQRPTSDLGYNATSVLATFAFEVNWDLYSFSVKIGASLSGSRAEEEVEEEIHLECRGSRWGKTGGGCWCAGLMCDGERSEVGRFLSTSSYTRGVQAVPKEAGGQDGRPVTQVLTTTYV